MNTFPATVQFITLSVHMSTLSFQFGNRHFALSDKKRDKTKVALKTL